jgi:hypothetical protein
MNNWVEYEISFNAHFRRALEMLTSNVTRNGKSFPHALYYAALELRIAIERVLWELMALPKATEGRIDELSRNEIKLYRPKEIWQKMLSIDPLLEKRLAFLGILCKVDSKLLQSTKEVIREPNFEMPDINKLDELYGRIGSYLHAIEKRKSTINDPGYWDRFNDLLKETIAQLDKTASARMHFTPSGAAKEGFDMFLGGSSEEEVIAFMQSKRRAAG